MKRILAFLLLFGAGLGVLLFVESRGGSEANGGGPHGPSGPSGATGAPAPTGPVVPPIPDDPDRRAFTPGGSFVFTGRGEPGPDGVRPVQYELSWEDSTPGEDDRLDLEGVHIEVYDEETGALQAEVDAALGALVVREDGAAFTISIEDDVELQDAVLTVRDGLPWSPVELHTSLLAGSLEARTFTTDRPAVIEGPGLSATGTGMGFDAAEGRLVLHRDIEARVTTEDGRVTLTCDDLLGIRRDEASGEGGLLLAARGAAQLGSEGEDAAAAPSLGAEEIELRGRRATSPSGDEPSFELTRVEADGEVVYGSPELDLFAASADLDLDDTGRVTSGELRGAHSEHPDGPRAVVTPPAEGADELPEGTREAGPVELVGDELLTLRDEGRRVLDAPGRARLAWGDATLTATDGIVLEADGATGDLTAGGVVVVEAPEATLTAPGLTATIERDAAGQAVLVATAAAPTETTGATQDGVPFTFGTNGALVVELHGERFRVREARGASLQLHDASELVAHADLVTDFDHESLALTATGAVDVSGLDAGERFAVTGEELVAKGRDDLVVRGAEGARAVFSGPDGNGEAREVVRRGETLEATGDVEAHLETEGVAYDLACARLFAVRREGLQTARAEGGVSGTVDLPGRRVELDCATLDVNRSEDEEGTRATTVLAGGVERAEITTTDEATGAVEVWEVDCATFDAGRLVNADGVVLSEDLAARDEVVVTRRTPGAPSFVGHGDLFTYDGEEGRLVATGNDRVRAVGELPGQAWPFSLTADWVAFTETRVRAGDPDLRVTRLVEQPGGGPPRTLPLQALADELTATEDAALLRGDVVLTGEASEDATWVLESAFARIEGDAPGDLADPAGAEGSWRSVHAWGGYTFRLGASVRSEGEQATAIAATNRLLLEGDPATLRFGAFHMRSEWIEFDTVTNAWRSGPGTLGQASAEDPR